MKKLLIILLSSLTVISYAGEEEAGAQNSKARFREYTLQREIDNARIMLENNEIKATCNLFLEFAEHNREAAELLESFGALEDCKKNGSEVDKLKAISIVADHFTRRSVMQDVMHEIFLLEEMEDMEDEDWF